MRLIQLELHNFRCYPDLVVEFEPATVLIGPNDAGKSTILDALRCLLSPSDRFGKPFVRRTVASMNDLSMFLIYDEGEAELLPEEAVTVVATFGDLSDLERSAWAPVLTEGTIVVGVLFLPYVGEAKGVLEGGYGERIGPMYVLDVDAPYSEPGWDGVLRDGLAFAVGDAREYRIGRRRWAPMIGRVLGPLPELVMIPGPDVAPLAPDTYLRPLLRVAQRRALEDIPEETFDYMLDAVDRITSAPDGKLTEAIPRYLDAVTNARIWQSNPVVGPEGMASEARMQVMESLVGPIDILVSRPPQKPDLQVPWDEPSAALGAGARRAIALASLELYRDAELWPPDRPIIVAVEEPEVGLHPGAQRRIASSLRQLPTFGVQTIVVTHSPIVLNAARPEGVRVVKKVPEADGGWRHEVLIPENLREIVDLLGVSPADVLLGQHFVVVEGESDVAVLTVWARKVGLDFETLGVRLFAAGSWSSAATVAKLVETRFEPGTVHVVLDGGPDTSREAAKIMRDLGDRVSVDVLDRPEIEMYFSRAAVERWFVTMGADKRELDIELGLAAEDGISKNLLNRAYHALFGGSYPVTQGARAIAGMMEEGDLSALIPLLMKLAGSERNS